MSAKIIDGRAISEKLRERIKSETQELLAGGITPGLAVVIVGDDPASRTYVNDKKKACAQVGFYSEEHALPRETTQEELIALVRELNARSDIHGILVQLPLPAGLSERRIIRAIAPEKDVDCFSPVNAGLLFNLGEAVFLPCTPAGVMELLKYYELLIQQKFLL